MGGDPRPRRPSGSLALARLREREIPIQLPKRRSEAEALGLGPIVAPLEVADQALLHAEDRVAVEIGTVGREDTGDDGAERVDYDR
jgi:hypothetical protein